MLGVSRGPELGAAPRRVRVGPHMNRTMTQKQCPEKLDELLRQRQSLFESSQEAVKSFFRSLILLLF